MENRFSQTATSAWQKIALVFLGLILSLVLLEAGLRLGGFILSSIQAYGNFQSAKQKDAYRILCIGESTTQGQYPFFLERILNRRNIGVHFSVIDEGRSGENTNTLLKEIESNVAEYHPNLVVAMMGINDRGKHMPFEKAATSKWTLFIRSFRIYRMAGSLELHLLTKAKEMGFYKPGEAKDSFKEAIEINPQGTRAMGALAPLYEEMGKPELAREYAEKTNRLSLGDAVAVTANNYRELKKILDEKGILLVCVQYPVRSLEPLKKIFEKDKGVIFVDNEHLFKTAVRKDGYAEYFGDMFGGDFGHCTPKGNMLLARNIADVILREVFKKP